MQSKKTASDEKDLLRIAGYGNLTNSDMNQQQRKHKQTDAHTQLLSARRKLQSTFFEQILSMVKQHSVVKTLAVSNRC